MIETSEIKLESGEAAIVFRPDGPEMCISVMPRDEVVPRYVEFALAIATLEWNDPEWVKATWEAWLPWRNKLVAVVDE